MTDDSEFVFAALGGLVQHALHRSEVERLGHAGAPPGNRLREAPSQEGGPAGGDGGFAEVSGAGSLTLLPFSVMRLYGFERFDGSEIVGQDLGIGADDGAAAGTTVEVIEEHDMVLFDDAVTGHLFEVAAGLRSSVLGETEVLGQVRRAAEIAEAERAAGPVLSGLFGRAVKAGRKVRSSTAIARGATSLSHVAVELATARLGGSLAGRKILVVGAGTMGEGIVDALSQRPDSPEVVVANRTEDRARALADRAGGEGVGMAGAAPEEELVLADGCAEV